jgi:hypothetical protein
MLSAETDNEDITGIARSDRLSNALITFFDILIELPPLRVGRNWAILGVTVRGIALVLPSKYFVAFLFEILAY